MSYHVDRITLEPQPAAVVSGSVPHDGIAEFLGGAFGEVMAVLAAEGLAPAGPPFARYVMTDDGWDIEAGFPSSREVTPHGRVHATTLPGGTALAVLHQGPYEDVAAAYHAAELWMAENDWTATGAPWEAYLDGPEVAEPRTIVHLPARPV
jgi:effector-binding domain-containing protein